MVIEAKYILHHSPLCLHPLPFTTPMPRRLRILICNSYFPLFRNSQFWQRTGSNFLDQALIAGDKGVRGVGSLEPKLGRGYGTKLGNGAHPPYKTCPDKKWTNGPAALSIHHRAKRDNTFMTNGTRSNCTAPGFFPTFSTPPGASQTTS